MYSLVLPIYNVHCSTQLHPELGGSSAHTVHAQQEAEKERGQRSMHRDTYPTYVLFSGENRTIIGRAAAAHQTSHVICVFLCVSVLGPCSGGMSNGPSML